MLKCKIFSIKALIAQNRKLCRENALRTTEPFVTAHLEVFHFTHYPVIIPKSDLYFTVCFA